MLLGDSDMEMPSLEELTEEEAVEEAVGGASGEGVVTIDGGVDAAEDVGVVGLLEAEWPVAALATAGLFQDRREWADEEEGRLRGGFLGRFLPLEDRECAYMEEMRWEKS